MNITELNLKEAYYDAYKKGNKATKIPFDRKQELRLITGLIFSVIKDAIQDRMWNYWLSSNQMEKDKLKNSLMFIYKKLP